MHAERLRASSPEQQPRVEAVTGRDAIADPRTDALLDFADAVNGTESYMIPTSEMIHGVAVTETVVKSAGSHQVEKVV